MAEDHSSPARRRLTGLLAVVVSSAGGVLLLLAALAFGLYGYCEDYCEKPPWSFWHALGWGLVPGVPALAVLTVAAFLWMRADGRGSATWPRALIVGAMSFAMFLAGLALLIWVASARELAGAQWGVIALILGAGWLALTAIAARRAGRRARV